MPHALEASTTNAIFVNTLQCWRTLVYCSKWEIVKWLAKDWRSEEAVVDLFTDGSFWKIAHILQNRALMGLGGEETPDNSGKIQECSILCVSFKGVANGQTWVSFRSSKSHPSPENGGTMTKWAGGNGLVGSGGWVKLKAGSQRPGSSDDSAAKKLINESKDSWWKTKAWEYNELMEF